ncbi:MAG TPA: serine/threonine-protein kinase, partial [Gemmatimonadaceae bacterium]|nr:serine/threonine-protein kinase [Gemmatimonadaceae bacterium]
VGDKFELLELLGRGGMGIVFRAREVALDREVALKVLALDPLMAPEAFGRFEREAKLAARLDHPNVVPIFSVGQGGSVAYYTMRLVRGGSVEELIAGGRQLDLQQTVAILRDVAAALDYAHRLGVVHRDIKPANILLGEGGHATVADFGIAKALGPADGTTATGTGVIGSPGYMSPEQWRGDAVDGRADQYALGIVAFEMLAGRRPFETVRVQDLLALHLTADVPSLSAIRAGIDLSADAAIARALAKYPSERFPSASAFVETLAGRRPMAASAAARAAGAGAAVSGAGATRATQSVGATRALASDVESSRGGGALLAVALTVLLLGGAAGVASVVPATRPTVLHEYERARASLTAALAARSAPRYAATSPRPGAPTLPDSGTVARAADSVATGDSLASTETGTRIAEPPQRAPIGLDPALLGHALGPDGAPVRGRTGAGVDDVGYLRIVTRGGSARVRIDGRGGFGFTPLVVRLDPGPHSVTVEGAGDAFLPSQLAVDVAGGDTASAVFTARGWSTPAPTQQVDSASSAPAATPPASDSAHHTTGGR